MSTAQIFALVGNAIFVLVVVTVSLRLLLLWRRTREWPEMLIGSGLLVMAGVGFPLLGLAGLDRPSMAEVSVPMVAAGGVSLTASILLLQSFNWQVFRPDSRLAGAFVAANGLAMAAIGIGLVRALVAAPADALPMAVHTPYSLALRLAFEVWYLWIAVDSLREWSRARRRLALGLSDPVVVNRFALWGSMGVFLASNGVVAMLFEANGLSPVVDALPAFWLALNGAGAGVLMLLTFAPPASYVAWIRRRHALSAAP